MKLQILPPQVLCSALLSLPALTQPWLERAFTLDHNRMVVEVEIQRPDGSLRRAKAWVDTGSETLTVSEALARDLGLKIPPFQQAGSSAPSVSKPPALSMGGLPLETEGIPVKVQPGKVVRAGVQAELNLPARVFRKHRVLFDYPAARLTLAPSAGPEKRGVPVPCRIHPDTGLLQIPVSIDGAIVELAVDLGSAGTWVSERLVQSWKARHPEWPSAKGAAGSANFFGFSFESTGLLLRLPELQIGGHPVLGVGLLGVDQGIIDWYSRKTAGPVQGFIGANVLKGFRLEIDFPNGMTYWTLADSTPECFDQVGLTLRPLPGGDYAVAGVLEQGGRACVEGVSAGDLLVSVGELEVSGIGMGAVIEALRGKPGDMKILGLKRDGKPHSVRAKVLHLI